VSAFDSDGRLTVNTVTKKPKNTRGDYDVKWKFKLHSAHGEDGYIIQHVTYSAEVTDCFTSGVSIYADDYYEAWLVKSGSVMTTFNSDYDDNAGERHGTP